MKRVQFGTFALLAALATVGCTSNSSDSSSSGGFNVTGSVASLSGSSLKAQAVGKFSPTTATTKMRCCTVDSPVVCKESSFDTNGGFDVAFSADEKARGISCRIVNSSNPKEEICKIGIEGTSVDLSGQTSVNLFPVMESSTDYGSLSCSDGLAKKPAGSIAGLKANDYVPVSPFDFSGTWIFKAYDLAYDTSIYQGACPAGSQDCMGPSENESVYVKRLNGTTWNRDATCIANQQNGTIAPDDTSTTCGGTASSTAQYGITVWKSATAYATCGSKLGFTYNYGKTLGIDLTNSGVNEGVFSWSGGYTEGWKKTTARANWAMQDCESTTVTVGSETVPGWKCWKNDDSTYYVNIDRGGCTDDSTGEQLFIQNWTGLGSPSCQNDSSGLPTGYTGQSCTYTNADHDGDTSTAARTFTCRHAGGHFNANGTVNGGNFDWNNVSSFYAQASPMPLCSSLNPSSFTGAKQTRAQLALLRCYADSMWQDNNTRDENYCIRRVETNWMATSAADFLSADNEPRKAQTQHVIAPFRYLSDTKGVFGQRSVYYRGVQTGSNSWTACKVEEMFEMSLEKVSDTVMYAKFSSQTTLLDSKEACVGAKDQIQQVMKPSLMKLEKQ